MIIMCNVSAQSIHFFNRTLLYLQHFYIAVSNRAPFMHTDLIGWDFSFSVTGNTAWLRCDVKEKYL